MDYLTRLDNALEQFENSAKSLADVTELIRSIDTLTREIEEQKKLTDTEIELIKKADADITEYARAVNTLVKDEEAARNEYLAVLKTSIVESTNRTMETYESVLKTLSGEINTTSNEILQDAKTKNKELKSHVSSELETKTNDLKERIEQNEKAIKSTRIISIITLIICVATCIFAACSFFNIG